MTQTDSSHYIVVTVSSISERSKLIKQLYTTLTKEPSKTFFVRQDQVNRIRIYQNVSPEIKVIVRTYLVIVVPVTLDLDPLYSLQGVIDYKLDNTIEHLTSIIEKLRALQGRQIRRGNPNATLGRLVDQLHTIR